MDEETLKIYRSLKARENWLFLELLRVRAELAVVEVPVDAYIDGVSPKAVSKPEQLVDLWTVMLSQAAADGVLEYDKSREILEQWADNQRCSQSLRFGHRNSQAEFIKLAIWQTYRNLQNMNIRWESTGRSIMHNKTRTVGRLVATIISRLTGEGK